MEYVELLSFGALINLPQNRSKSQTKNMPSIYFLYTGFLSGFPVEYIDDVFSFFLYMIIIFSIGIIVIVYYLYTKHKKQISTLESLNIELDELVNDINAKIRRSNSIGLTFNRDIFLLREKQKIIGAEIDKLSNEISKRIGIYTKSNFEYQQLTIQNKKLDTDIGEFADNMYDLLSRSSETFIRSVFTLYRAKGNKAFNLMLDKYEKNFIDLVMKLNNPYELIEWLYKNSRNATGMSMQHLMKLYLFNERTMINSKKNSKAAVCYPHNDFVNIQGSPFRDSAFAYVKEHFPNAVIQETADIYNLRPREGNLFMRTWRDDFDSSAAILIPHKKIIDPNRVYHGCHMVDLPYEIEYRYTMPKQKLFGINDDIVEPVFQLIHSLAVELDRVLYNMKGKSLAEIGLLLDSPLYKRIINREINKRIFVFVELLYQTFSWGFKPAKEWTPYYTNKPWPEPYSVLNNELNFLDKNYIHDNEIFKQEFIINDKMNQYSDNIHTSNSSLAYIASEMMGFNSYPTYRINSFLDYKIIEPTNYKLDLGFEKPLEQLLKEAVDKGTRWVFDEKVKSWMDEKYSEGLFHDENIVKYYTILYGNGFAEYLATLKLSDTVPEEEYVPPTIEERNANLLQFLQKSTISDTNKRSIKNLYETGGLTDNMKNYYRMIYGAVFDEYISSL